MFLNTSRLLLSLCVRPSVRQSGSQLVHQNRDGRSAKILVCIIIFQVLSNNFVASHVATPTPTAHHVSVKQVAGVVAVACAVVESSWTSCPTGCGYSLLAPTL